MAEGGSDKNHSKDHPAQEHKNQPESPAERIKSAGPIEAAGILGMRFLDIMQGKDIKPELIGKNSDKSLSSGLDGNITERSKNGEISIHDKHGNNVLSTDLPKSSDEKKVEQGTFTISQDGSTITTPDKQVWHLAGVRSDNLQQWQKVTNDSYVIWNGHAKVVDGKLLATDLHGRPDKDCPMVHNPLKKK
jgi:hypothetical protein